MASWRFGVLASAVGLLSVLGPLGAAGATGTTTSVPLTAAQWQQRYEPFIGQIADDVLVVFTTGKRYAKHPTKKKVQSIITACQKWADDARRIPNQVPPVPVAAAERAWKGLLAASASGSSDCLAALRRGSKPAVNDFHRQLALANSYEKQLAKQMGNS